MVDGGPGNYQKEVREVDTEEVLVIGEEVPKNLHTNYLVERDDGERVHFRRYHRHSLNHKPIPGRRYHLKHVEFVETRHKRYFKNTSETALTDVTESVPTDLVITGDTHIGYGDRDPRDWHRCYEGAEPCHKVFQKVVGYAIREGVDGIIHTGDLYDGKEIDDFHDWTKEGLQLLSEKEIGFAYIRGNHDPQELMDDIEDIERVMHIGDGNPRNWNGFAFLGFDYTTSSAPEEIEVEILNRTALLFGHPTGSAIHSFISRFEELRCHIFLGHQHNSDNSKWDSYDAEFVGSPARISHNESPSIRRFRGLNGVVQGLWEVPVDEL